MSVIKLAFLDVGQGDTTIITCPDTHEAIVVDCVDSEVVFDYLKRERITHLRGIIITHLHADHYKEVASLLDSYHDEDGALNCEILATTEPIPRQPPKSSKNQAKWLPDGDRHSVVFEQPSAKHKTSLARLYLWCQKNKKKCKPILADSNVLFPIQGDIAQSIKVIHPYFVDLSDLKQQALNDISVVLQVTGTGACALLTGDLEPNGWEYLKNQHQDLKSDVLKFPHHGGAWHQAEIENLLSIVQPSIVTISVGSNNSYDHPNEDVFEAIKKHPDIRLFCTQVNNKCQSLAQDEYNNVIIQFERQSKVDRSFFFPPRAKECPCAGSVIIELRDEPLIIQPNVAFHETIINDHFKQHKCYIRPNLTTDKLEVIKSTSETYL